MKTTHGRTDNRLLRRTSAALLASAAAATAWQGTPVADARAAKLPDLAVTSVTAAQKHVEAGNGIDVRAVVRNVGRATAGVVRFSLSKDKRAGKDVALRPAIATLALEPGKQLTLPPTLDVPATTPAGKYYVLACARADGRDATKGNDCKASKKRVRVDAPLQGSLTGQIVFDRASASTTSNTEEHAEDHATVDVDVDVDLRKDGWKSFANSGSTWNYVGSSERTVAADGCLIATTSESAGFGTLRQTGDQYEDDLLGDFSRNDHSRIRLLIGLRYDYTVRTDHTPVGELGCLPESSTDGPRELRALVDLDLRQTKKTDKAITYRLVGAKDPYSNTTTWDTATGTLTLAVK